MTAYLKPKPCYLSKKKIESVKKVLAFLNVKVTVISQDDRQVKILMSRPAVKTKRELDSLIKLDPNTATILFRIYATIGLVVTDIAYPDYLSFIRKDGHTSGMTIDHVIPQCQNVNLTFCTWNWELVSRQENLSRKRLWDLCNSLT